MADLNMTLELTNAGNGIAALLDAIRPALMSFLLAMGIIVGVIGLIAAIIAVVRRKLK